MAKFCKYVSRHFRMMKFSLLVLVSLAAIFGSGEAFMQHSGLSPSFVRAAAVQPLKMTVLSYNGKKKNFPPGSPLSKAVSALGVKVKYSCKK